MIRVIVFNDTKKQIITREQLEAGIKCWGLGASGGSNEARMRKIVEAMGLEVADKPETQSQEQATRSAKE